MRAQRAVVQSLKGRTPAEESIRHFTMTPPRRFCSQNSLNRSQIMPSKGIATASTPDGEVQPTPKELGIIRSSGLIAGAFVIRDIRILRVAKDGEDSTFVAFPSRRWNAGDNGAGEGAKYYDVAFPITAQAYQEATGSLLREYERLAALQQSKPS